MKNITRDNVKTMSQEIEYKLADLVDDFRKATAKENDDLIKFLREQAPTAAQAKIDIIKRFSRVAACSKSTWSGGQSITNMLEQIRREQAVTIIENTTIYPQDYHKPESSTQKTLGELEAESTDGFTNELSQAELADSPVPVRTEEEHEQVRNGNFTLSPVTNRSKCYFCNKELHDDAGWMFKMGKCICPDCVGEYIAHYS